MPLAIQTPTGTIYMEIDEFLRMPDEDWKGLHAHNEVDPLAVKIPSNSREITELSDIEEIEEVPEKESSQKNN